jgi:hypothetical protein
MKNRWSLVIHEVAEKTVNIWVGTLFHDLRKPKKVTVKIFDRDQRVVNEKYIAKDEWERPFRQISSQRFCKQLTFNGLLPGCDYKIILEEHFDNNLNQEAFFLSSGTFTTLPISIEEMEHGFTVGLGSCFYEEFDGVNVGTSFEILSKADNFPYKPHIKFLTGDQVYLDIGWDSLSTIPKEIRERVANDYALHWQALRGVLRNGGTWFLSDDHEFWNNYPLVQGWSPFIQALRIPSIKKAWLGTARDGVNNVQCVSPVRFFSISNELSFCVADLRAYRSKKNVLPEKHLNCILKWLRALTNPGILVLSQPVMEKISGDGDRNFVFYKRQYKKVIKAIHDAEHDVLVLSGDVHHGRISKVEFPNRSNKLVEVVSSPMSNLSGISSIATSEITKESRLKKFPPITVPGVPSADISYQSPWKVSSESKLLDLRYLKRRTKEHFFTLSFEKNSDDSINVTVRSWLVRERDDKTGLPKQNWKNKPMTFILR